MHLTTFDQNLAVSAVAVLMALVHAVLGARQRRSDPPWARANFLVAFAALALAVLILLQAVSPVVGYSLVCLAEAGFQLFDLLQDERTRRRRVASLAPRPAAETVPTVWVALAVACGLMLAPYVILDEQRGPAFVVAACAFAMASIAWRIASGPVQLYGDDIRSERLRDRASRSGKAGVTAVVAMGSVMAFISFVNYDLSTVLPLQRTLLVVSWWTWALSAVSVVVYSRYLRRLSSSPS